jgi:hypothetical protein
MPRRREGLPLDRRGRSIERTAISVNRKARQLTMLRPLVLCGGVAAKPANMKENRRDRRPLRNQTGKRKVVVILRERDGNSVPAVFNSEAKPLHPSALAA